MIVIHQVQEFIAKLKLAHFVMFIKFLGNLDFVRIKLFMAVTILMMLFRVESSELGFLVMIMQIFVQNSVTATIL
jgi:hypothetical protein